MQDNNYSPGPVCYDIEAAAQLLYEREALGEYIHYCVTELNYGVKTEPLVNMNLESLNTSNSFSKEQAAELF